jgi:SAM-dependent methyltransferase
MIKTGGDVNAGAKVSNRLRQYLLLLDFTAFKSVLPSADPRRRPWRDALEASTFSSRRRCNICGWHGEAFASAAHSEGALCTHCGSIARDRFLFWCWIHRSPYQKDATILETSPRLDQRYRGRMSQLVHYLASDYDQSAHKASIELDLQDVNLPTASVSTILTSHVLEHVPDTGRALSEMHRILKPGGRMYLQVPMTQGVTAVPTEREYHADHTLVYWHFGWDLRDQLEAVGFVVECLVTSELVERLRRGHYDSGYRAADCDEADLLWHAKPFQLLPIANAAESCRHGFQPDFHFITWEAIKP